MSDSHSMDDGKRNFYIQYVPELSRPPIKQEKKKVGHIVKLNDKGIFYPDGMGCSRNPNCFQCDEEDCEFLSEGKWAEDLPYMSNRGDGIKP